MKIKSLYVGALAFSMIAVAHADVTVNITGATAFRQATLNTIKERFASTGQPFKYAHDKASGGTTFNTAGLSIWIGTFPGIPGTTTIRTSFSGSVEGIRALVNSPADDPLYLKADVLANTTAAVGGAELGSQTSPTERGQSHIAFSDVNKAATPYSAYNLLPTNSAAGVVVFTMIGSEGTPLTNITSQQFRALFGRGFQPLSYFTGNPTDEPYSQGASVNAAWVFATGRNDGSGTRTTYLAETGYGVTNSVKQYTVLESASGAMTKIQLVPAGGVNVPAQTGQDPKNASTVWGQDTDGNGGYNSGGTLATNLGYTGNAVTVLDASYEDAFGEPQKLTMVSFVSLSDAVTARNNGAVFLAYNGVKLDGIAANGATQMSAGDLAKVTNGLYTAWSYQQMYRRNDITSETDDGAGEVYKAIKDNLVLGTAGIPIAQMKVGREYDGGTVAP